MDLYDDYLRERQQRLDLAEKTMRAVKGEELAEKAAELLGSDPGTDLLDFVAELRKQPAKRFLVGRFEERGYYALDRDAGTGFWMGEWNEGNVPT